MIKTIEIRPSTETRRKMNNGLVRLVFNDHKSEYRFPLLGARIKTEEEALYGSKESNVEKSLDLLIPLVLSRKKENYLSRILSENPYITDLLRDENELDSEEYKILINILPKGVQLLLKDRNIPEDNIDLISEYLGGLEFGYNIYGILFKFSEKRNLPKIRILKKYKIK